MLRVRDLSTSFLFSSIFLDGCWHCEHRVLKASKNLNLRLSAPWGRLAFSRPSALLLLNPALEAGDLWRVCGSSEGHLEGRPLKGSPTTPSPSQTSAFQQLLQLCSPVLSILKLSWSSCFSTLPPGGTKPFSSKD